MNKLFCSLTIVLMFASCSKDSNSNSSASNTFFPPVAVNVKILLTDPTYGYLSLQQGGYACVLGGNRGIIIYHTINDDYVAFDRTCPVDPTKDCAYVTMDSSGGLFFKCAQFPNAPYSCGRTCTTGGFCSSKFDAATGFPISGSAKLPLKQYIVKKDATYLYITN